MRIKVGLIIISVRILQQLMTADPWLIRNGPGIIYVAPTATLSLHCYAFAAVFHFFCVRAQGTHATQLLVVNGKIKNSMLLNFVPPNFFDSFTSLLMK